MPPDLSREIAAWIAAHPERTNPRAFLFPNRRETPYSVGNYLKRYLKPLAERVGIHDLTHQAFRRTSSTHIQDYASVKDLQGHLRHTNPQTTLKHYTKVIPESLRAAVAALDANYESPPQRTSPENLQPRAAVDEDASAPESPHGVARTATRQRTPRPESVTEACRVD